MNESVMIGGICTIVGMALGKVFDFVLTYYKGTQEAKLTELESLLKGYRDMVDILQKQADQTRVDQKEMLAQFLQERIENATLKLKIAARDATVVTLTANQPIK